jgi:predicted nucleic acid-binding protein
VKPRREREKEKEKERVRERVKKKNCVTANHKCVVSSYLHKIQSFISEKTTQTLVQSTQKKINNKESLFIMQFREREDHTLPQTQVDSQSQSLVGLEELLLVERDGRASRSSCPCLNDDVPDGVDHRPHCALHQSSNIHGGRVVKHKVSNDICDE